MEHLRIIRDGSSSPHPVGNPAAPLIQADPSLLAPNRRVLDAEFPASPSPPPPTTYTEKSRFSSLGSVRSKLANLRFWPSRSKPGLSQGFERPSFSRIAILTVLCLIVYPAFYILTLVAKDKSLFTVRLIVSAWCSGLGFALGYILLKIGARHLEAATWATVIHMSYEGGGMKLRDLARSSSNPTSFVPAFHTLQYRFRNREVSRSSRGPYDTRPWPLFLGFFVALAILGPLLPFLFGRIIEIEIFVRNPRIAYNEVLIAGDLSQEDIIQAKTQLNAFVEYGGSISDTTELVYDNDTVYFAHPSLSQFVPGGSGPGTFIPAPISLRVPPTGRNVPKSDVGRVLRYPQWGIRIHCEKLPDPKVNLVLFLSRVRVYIFIPRDFLQGLFGVYGMALPTQFTGPDLSALTLDDMTIPSNINPSKISYIAEFWGPDQGVYINTTHYQSDQGWTTIETILLRYNTRYTPSGYFPVHSDITGYGFDAAVCVQKYEPWVIETYNTSTGSPSTLRIIGKGDASTSLSPNGNIHGPRISSTRYLNTTGKENAFRLAELNGIRMITGIEPDGQDSAYFGPPPSVVSFTNGTGQGGYTELSPDRLATTRAQISAACTLPYLMGSGPVVAQSYMDQTLAYATYRWRQLISLLTLIWILGIVGELFAPMLPLNIPRRDFGVYSWLALFQSQELQFEAVNDLDQFMTLRELEKKTLDKRVKFVV